MKGVDKEVESQKKNRVHLTAHTLGWIYLWFNIFPQYLVYWSLALLSFFISLGLTCKIGFTFTAGFGVVPGPGVANKVFVADSWDGVLTGDEDEGVVERMLVLKAEIQTVFSGIERLTFLMYWILRAVEESMIWKCLSNQVKVCNFRFVHK